MIFAARSGGIMPLGYIAERRRIRDWERFAAWFADRASSASGRELIHPGQVTT